MPSKKSSKKINPPKGTRDLYPEDLLRQRYITNAWRDASIRCGFEEIAGPTFESTDLYAVKSGDGILNELFQAFSGKSPAEIEQVQATGTAPYALRPEFTPTLARMYAARSKELPKPCKWFTAGPYFRAERPQRGRLREFLQWNVDFIADDNSSESRAIADAEILSTIVNLFQLLGLSNGDVTVAYSDRRMAESVLREFGASDSTLSDWLAWIDFIPKNPRIAERNAHELGLTQEQHDLIIGFFFDQKENSELYAELERQPELTKEYLAFQQRILSVPEVTDAMSQLQRAGKIAENLGIKGWGFQHNAIVRGLAYYTGLVFEAIADGERAVAGGGRYDNLIELFGGPPTPACGFGMGDVVLSNLLDDKDLMPTGLELREAVSRPQASIRPDAFIVPNGDEANEPLVHTLAANLRRGIESESWLSREDHKPWQQDRYSVAPMHARISYKSTRNLGKLKADAAKQHAKFLVEIHGPDKVELRDMDQRDAHTSSLGSFSIDPAAENYIGNAIADRL